MPRSFRLLPGEGREQPPSSEHSLTHSFIGVILVTRSDSTSESAGIDATGTNLPTHPIWGDLLSLLSAAWYSIYVILLKVRIGDESRADTQLLLG